MSIYAISDLHLAFNKEKPMDIFGSNWKNHHIKVKEDWLEKVKPDDLVILAGDFSWANTLEEALDEFTYLEELPGTKILLKGNHDYWWNSITKMNEFLKQHNITTINFLHNNSYIFNNHIIAGTRGWQFPENEEDIKMLKRELIRLELSLQDGVTKYGHDKPIIAITHYPPFMDEYIELMNKYNVTNCIYGHLHGKQDEETETVENSNIKFKLTSCDFLNFKLYKIN